MLTGGWFADIDFLKRLRPNYAAMVPSTAVLFFLSSTVLIVIQTVVRDGGLRRVLLIATAILAALIALADLTVIFSGAATGIDALIWPQVDEFSTHSMAPATAVCFLLTAVCIYMLWDNKRFHAVIYVSTATLGLILSLIALVGYLFDASALYEVSIFTAMALHTAVCFVILFTAILLYRPHLGWVNLLMRDESGSIGARRLFPIVIMTPLVFCVIALWLTRAGFFNADFRLAALAIVMMALLAASVLHNAATANKAERKLKATMDELRVLADDKDLLLREVYHRVKNNLQQINALIMIEAASLKNEDARASLKSMSDRIQALGTVHRLLISSNSPSQLNVESFLSDLCNSIASGQGAESRNIQITVDTTSRSLPIDVSISLGLLINELVSNSLKHAFSGRETGTIHIIFKDNDDTGATLIVEDNGTGLAQETNDDLPGNNAGSRIIRGLTAQLQASMKIETEQGMRVVISLPPGYSTRGQYE